MTIWDLERRIIDVIRVELQVPRGRITPESRLVDDLRADWLSLERLSAALETQLGLRLAPSSFFGVRVWDFVKECHCRYSGGPSIDVRSGKADLTQPSLPERSMSLSGT